MWGDREWPLWRCSQLPWHKGRWTRAWGPLWWPQLLLEVGRTQGYEQRGAWGCCGLSCGGEEASGARKVAGNGGHHRLGQVVRSRDVLEAF